MGLHNLPDDKFSQGRHKYGKDCRKQELAELVLEHVSHDQEAL